MGNLLTGTKTNKENKLIDASILDSINLYNYVTDKLTSTIDSILQDEFQKDCQLFLANYRKIDIKFIREAKIFYILNSDHLNTYGIDNYDLDILGFSYNMDNIFRERFIIPIIDLNNKVIGMSGYDYDSDIKYLFAKTEFFDKRNSLYNKQNLTSIINSKIGILVEGFFDSIRLNQMGFNNNVSLMGTMLFPYQKTMLQRIEGLIEIPDSDKVGKDALRYWNKALKKKTAIIYLPDGIKDIDMYFKYGIFDMELAERVVDREIMEEENKNYIIEYNEEMTDRKNKFCTLYNKIKSDISSPFYMNYKEYYLKL